MKLYVVGSASSDPSVWAQEAEGFAIVIAADAKTALAIAEEDPNCPVCEISMTSPTMLVSMIGNEALEAMAG